MAKYLVVKKVVSEETHHLIVESEHKPEFLEFVAQEYGDDVFGEQEFEPQYDRCDSEEYEVRLLKEGESLPEDVPVWGDEETFDEAAAEVVEEFTACAKS